MPRNNFDPMAAMLEKIVHLQAAVPFTPFVITTSSGRSFAVPTPDHITVTRLHHDVVIEDDDGMKGIINPLHVASIELRPQAA